MLDAARGRSAHAIAAPRLLASKQSTATQRAWAEAFSRRRRRPAAGRSLRASNWRARQIRVVLPASSCPRGSRGRSAARPRPGRGSKHSSVRRRPLPPPRWPRGHHRGRGDLVSCHPHKGRKKTEDRQRQRGSGGSSRSSRISCPRCAPGVDFISLGPRGRGADLCTLFSEP